MSNATEALRELRRELLRRGMPNAYTNPTETEQWMLKAWDALELPELARAVLAEPPKEVAALIERLRSWRAKLAELGGYDNDMLAVPAGGVRKVIDDAEQAADALARLSAPVPDKEK